MEKEAVIKATIISIPKSENGLQPSPIPKTPMKYFWGALIMYLESVFH